MITVLLQWSGNENGSVDEVGRSAGFGVPVIICREYRGFRSVPGHRVPTSLPEGIWVGTIWMTKG